MNKKIGLLLSLALLVGCSSGTTTEEVKKEKKSEKVSEKTTKTTTIANPFQDCESLEDAAKIAGFELSCPESVLESDSMLIQAIEEDMIQVIYDKNDEEVLRIRKSRSDDDITGDYNEYSEEVDQDINGISVHLKGENEKYSTVSWNVDEYQYCILSSSGLSLDDISNLVNSIQ